MAWSAVIPCSAPAAASGGSYRAVRLCALAGALHSASSTSAPDYPGAPPRAIAPSAMSTAGLRVFSVMLVVLEFDEGDDHQPERDARHVRAEQIAQHQLRRVIEHQHHRRSRDQRRVERRRQRQKDYLAHWRRTRRLAEYSGGWVGMADTTPVTFGRKRSRLREETKSRRRPMLVRLTAAQRPLLGELRVRPGGVSAAAARVQAAGRGGRPVGPRVCRRGHRADQRAGHDAARGRAGGVDLLYL